MHPYSFSMNVLNKFLDTTRAYLELARVHANQPKIERRHVSRLQVARNPTRALEYRENSPA